MSAVATASQDVARVPEDSPVAATAGPLRMLVRLGGAAKGEANERR